MEERRIEPALQQLGRPLKMVAVGLEEASLDSPSFRATANHFADQVEIIEKWLEAYVKSISKLTHDVTALEETFSTFLSRSVPPREIGEAVLDHDYTLLAMTRFGEGSRELWSQIFYGMRKMDNNIVEPIKSFMAGEYVHRYDTQLCMCTDPSIDCVTFAMLVDILIKHKRHSIPHLHDMSPNPRQKSHLRFEKTRFKFTNIEGRIRKLPSTFVCWYQSCDTRLTSY